MTIGELKEILAPYDEDTELFLKLGNGRQPGVESVLIEKVPSFDPTVWLVPKKANQE